MADHVYCAAAAPGALTVACLTAGIQAWRVVRSNPVEALPSE